MIDMHLKHDNMHTNGTFNALICINNHVNSCINYMLLIVASIHHIHYLGANLNSNNENIYFNRIEYGINGKKSLHA